MYSDKRCYDKSFTTQEFPAAMEDKSVKKDGFSQTMCCPNMCPPIMECPQERCCHRYICHEVPHD